MPLGSFLLFLSLLESRLSASSLSLSQITSLFPLSYCCFCRIRLPSSVAPKDLNWLVCLRRKIGQFEREKDGEHSVAQLRFRCTLSERGSLFSASLICPLSPYSIPLSLFLWSLCLFISASLSTCIGPAASEAYRPEDVTVCFWPQTDMSVPPSRAHSEVINILSIFFFGKFWLIIEAFELHSFLH